MISKIITFLKNAILFLCLDIIVLQGEKLNLPLSDYISLITYNPLISSQKQIDFITQIQQLKKSSSLRRYVRDSVMVSDTVLYQLTTNLPFSAKLINIGTQKNYEIIPLDSFSFYGNDHIALKGNIYLLANRDHQIIFYAEGTAKFLMKEYSMKGSMYVIYHPAGRDKTQYEAEIMIYPNNSFARNLLKILLSMGFGGYADQKISTINHMINRTALRMKTEPGWFNHVMTVDSLNQKYHLTPNDILFLKHILSHQH